MIDVAAAVVCREDKILMCQRPAEKNCGLLWEFPGGKIEEGETAEECAVRECREELNVTVKPKQLIRTLTYSYPDVKVRLHFYICTLEKGEPQKLEHNDIRWCSIEEIKQLDLCPADYEIINNDFDKVFYQGNNMIEKIRKYIFSQRDSIINDLRRFVKIPSISNPESKIKPFGAECRKVLDEYAKIAGEHGLFSRIFDYSCAAVAIGESELMTPEDTVGIWTHADVVPVDDGWIYPPFEGICENGLMIARGVQDNKCACIAVLYIFQCLRDMKIPLKGKHLWYAGSSEECGMQDIDLYLEKYMSPKLNLVADCGFPVCIGEKTIPPKDKNNSVVRCLTNTYNNITGRNDEPYVIGGNTYASKLPNAYPYGMIFGGKDKIYSYMPKGHGDYHQPDEAVEIDKLLEAMVIYVISIIELDKEISG